MTVSSLVVRNTRTVVWVATVPGGFLACAGIWRDVRPLDMCLPDSNFLELNQPPGWKRWKGPFEDHTDAASAAIGEMGAAAYSLALVVGKGGEGWQ